MFDRGGASLGGGDPDGVGAVHDSGLPGFAGRAAPCAMAWTTPAERPACGLEFASRARAVYIPSDHPTAIQAKARAYRGKRTKAARARCTCAYRSGDAAAVLDAGWGVEIVRTMGPGARVPQGLVVAPRRSREGRWWGSWGRRTRPISIVK